MSLPQAHCREQATAESTSLAGVRVLVVDDNAANRQILGRQLQAWQMEVAYAASGAEALRQLRAAADRAMSFALAVLDMHMPEMDGLTLAKAIVQRPELGAPRLLMLASAAADVDQLARRESGIRHFLNKPVRRADLLRVMLSALDRPPASFPASPWWRRPRRTPWQTPRMPARRRRAHNRMPRARCAAACCWSRTIR